MNHADACCKPCDCHCHKDPTYRPIQYPYWPWIIPQPPLQPFIWNQTISDRTVSTGNGTLPISSITYGQVQPN